ncbi:zinc-binding dehydrogenase [Rugamonas apoptosis]|uniref:Zinc-binding dehydrogenase n=1 Tax=Rugamonas apoptosis TaxID=2758570 RepID=A0A7W2IKB8_9BURK|nr:zinc-binding dehydrogenase [Rugamonas apoptosis]MBA5687379.1 zinc-binding dehydrogenase [Rugamonas apoptosis]
MKAVVRKEYGGPEVLVLREVDRPVPGAGEVLIEVRAFGLNRAELYMRRGEWGDAAAISGIECVGVVAVDPSGRLAPGQTVMACMGGMGRTVNGSYADYVVVRHENVISIDSNLDWAALAVLPESYAVAWTCLHGNLALRPGQRLLVRGGTSSLGLAAIDLALQLGAQVYATTRQTAHKAGLLEAGVEQAIVAEGALAGAGWDDELFDAVLDLVGNSTVFDSMRATRPGGRVCLAGFLGGMAPIEGFNPLSQMPSGVHLSFFGSFEFGGANFPLSAVPMQRIVRMVEAGRLRPRAGKAFGLDQLPAAHALMERNAACGKLVVVR